MAFPVFSLNGSIADPLPFQPALSCQSSTQQGWAQVISQPANLPFSLFVPLLFPPCKPPSHTTPSITWAEHRASPQNSSNGSSLLMLIQPLLEENACLGAGGQKGTPSKCLVFLNIVCCLLHSWAAAVAQVNWRAIRKYHNSADMNNCRSAIISGRVTVQAPQITVQLT